MTPTMLRTLLGVVLVLAGLGVYAFKPELQDLATAVMVAGAGMADIAGVGGLKPPKLPTSESAS